MAAALRHVDRARRSAHGFRIAMSMHIAKRAVPLTQRHVLAGDGLRAEPGRQRFAAEAEDLPQVRCL